MHLSIEQLQQLDHQTSHLRVQDDVPFDKIATLLSKNDYAHFSACDLCQSRFGNIQCFRERLSNSGSSEFPKFDFQNVLLASTSANVKVTDLSNVVEKNNAVHKKVFTFATTALAATFTLFVLLPFLITSDSSIEEQKLLALIKENEQIQTEFFQKQQKPQNNTLLMPVQIQLQDIDEQIQRSYINNSNPKQKLELWEKRKKLLLDSVEDQKPSPNFYI